MYIWERKNKINLLGKKVNDEIIYFGYDKNTNKYKEYINSVIDDKKIFYEEIKVFIEYTLAKNRDIKIIEINLHHNEKEILYLTLKDPKSCYKEDYLNFLRCGYNFNNKTIYCKLIF